MGMDLETLGGTFSLLDVTLLSSPISSFLISVLLWSGLSPPSPLQLFVQNHMASATQKVVSWGGSFPLAEKQRTERQSPQAHGGTSSKVGGWSPKCSLSPAAAASESPRWRDQSWILAGRWLRN